MRRNLIANYLGQGWTAIMGLAFIPFYIKYLGIEAYGLIGLFAVLQAWFALLDMGLTPALGREMARFTAGTRGAEFIRDLLRSVEIIAVGIAILMAIGIAIGSNWIATSWLKAEALPVSIVAQAFATMGLVTALRFVEGVYRSAIAGLQRQVLLNVVSSVMATLRGFGAVGVLAWIAPTLQAFFIWQGVISIATVGILAATTYGVLPGTERTARFSVDALRGVWRFAGGMLGITILSSLLTQVDKILLSNLLSLADFGYYTLAAVVAGSLYMLVTPITQAFYPRLCELHAQNNNAALINTYHNGAQLVTVIVGSIAIVLILFAETFLRLWTQDAALATRVAPLLSLLMLGNLLNGLMHIPYMTQLAYGWTGLAVRVNIVAVLLIVPAILWATPRFGAEGAAWVWIALNSGYVLVGIHFMFRRVLTAEKWRWYGQDILTPLCAGLFGGVLLAKFWPSDSSSVWNDVCRLGLATVLTLAISTLAANRVRLQVGVSVGRSWTNWKGISRL